LAIGLGWFRGTVRVTGFVPEPFRWLASADIFLAPLLTGAGVKLKVKEYQRFKAPILGTATAFEGIAKRPIDAECDPFAMALRILEALKTGRKG
jgi:glycosyltransferase involved in cell wall biosynthesis